MKNIYIFIIGILLFANLVYAGAPYPMVNKSTNISSDITNLLCYDQVITNNWFGYFLIWGFFICILVGSIFAQLRLSGRIVPETSLLASSLISFAWAVILAQKQCLVNPINFFFLAGLTIIAFIWVALKSLD